MKLKFNAWAFLRPLLIAVAAAASWAALSATGASADSSTAGDPLLGAAGPTVGSVASAPTHQAKDVLGPAEAGPAGDITAWADQLVQSGPVVNTAVPAGSAAAVTGPALDGIVDGTVGAVAPLAGAVLQPLQPVLDPVINVVPLPVVIEAAPPAAAPAPPADIPLPGEDTSSRAAEPQQAHARPATASAHSLSHRMLPNTGFAFDSRLKPSAGTVLFPEAGPGDVPSRTPSDVPPAAPGATGGSNSSGGNDPSAPAWICSHRFPAAAAGAADIQGRLLAAPAPMYGDPGSSPD